MNASAIFGFFRPSRTATDGRGRERYRSLSHRRPDRSQLVIAFM
jgi:hypothetical protein